MQLLLLAVVVLHLNSHDQKDSTVDGYSVNPTFTWMLNCLNDHVEGAETDEQLKSEVREGLLNQLEECLDLGDTLNV